MSDSPSKKFLKLIKVLFDVSTGVVRDFAENNILCLPEYGGSFIKFLDVRKHEIYHKWQSHTPCCHCGDNFKSCPKDIKNWRFEMLYQTISDRQVVCVKGKGLLKINGYMKQYCICNIIPKQMISLNEMDISMLSFLVRDCDITSFQLANIQILNTQRCRLCHAYSTHCFSNDDFDDIWKIVENSTLELAGAVNHYYHKSTKEHLKTLKTHDVTAEEHSKLHGKVLQEFSDMQKTNGIIKNGFTKCESNILEAKEEIIQNTDTKLAEITEHIEQLKASINVLIEQQANRTKSPNTSNDQHKGTSIHNDGEAGSADLNVQQGAIPKRKPNDKRHVRATCHVEGDELDELSAVQSLPEDNHNVPSDVCFNIISAEQKCLLLQLAVPSKVLESKESFRMALRALVIQIAGAGKIDTNKPSTITLNLIFNEVLTEVNMNMIQEISDNSFLSQMVEERLILAQLPTEELSTSRSTSTHSSNFTVYADAIQNEVRRVDEEERCSNCEKLSQSNIRLRTSNVQLESANQELIAANIKLQSLWMSLNSENSTLMAEIRKLQIQVADPDDEVAALNKKLNRQQEVQGWVDEGIRVSSSVRAMEDEIRMHLSMSERRMSSSNSSGTGSMADEIRMSPAISDDSLSYF